MFVPILPPSHPATNNAPSNPLIQPSPSPPLSPTTETATNPHTQIILASPTAFEPPPPSRVHGMITRSHNQIFKPTTFTDGRVRYSPPQALTALLHGQEAEPTCYTQASQHAQWRKAMNEGFDALLQNGTWSLVSPSPAMNVVGCKWVFQIKRKSDGQIERYKAGLVAKGFHQQPGIDFLETYSPVVKPITIRTVLSIAISAGWAIHQVDVSNAFLHGNLQETVYMAQPPEFQHPSHPTAVCKLHKALYGLKQAPRSWFSRLSTCLLELQFKSSKADSSLFIYNAHGIQMFVLIYVDDIIITSSHTGAISRLKDLGPLHFFLGVEATWSSDGLHLSQQRYILDVLKKTNMELAKPVATLMSSSSILSKFEGFTITDPTLYRNTIGSL